MTAEDDAEYCPASPHSPVSSPPDDVELTETLPRDVHTAPTSPVQTSEETPKPVAPTSVDEPSEAEIPAYASLPPAQPPQRDMHSGWDPSSIAMAKCDMCSRAGRGVVYKCSQCKLSVCRECCESGKLHGDSRHELDPASVSWEPSPKEKRTKGTRGSRARGGRSRIAKSRCTRGPSGGHGSSYTTGRGHSRAVSQASVVAISTLSATNSPAMATSDCAATGREASRDYTASPQRESHKVEHGGPRTHRHFSPLISHQQTDTHAGNSASIQTRSTAHEAYCYRARPPTADSTGPCRSPSLFHESSLLPPPPPRRFRESGQDGRHLHRYAPYQLPRYQRSPETSRLENHAGASERSTLTLHHAPSPHVAHSHPPASLHRRIWSSPEGLIDNQHWNMHALQEANADREPLTPPAQSVHQSFDGRDQHIYRSRTEEPVRLPPITPLLAETRPYIRLPTPVPHDRRPSPGWGHQAPRAAQAPLPREERRPEAPPSLAQHHHPQPPPRSHEGDAHHSHVEHLSRSVSHEAYDAYRTHHRTTPLDVCLRRELGILWTRHLLPARTPERVDDAFRTVVAVAHRSAAELGLDPLRNAARDWLREEQRALCEGGYEPLR